MSNIISINGNMSEALRLAEWVESDMTCEGDAEIAAELRRLHALNSELAGLLRQIIDSRDEHFIDQCVDGMWGWDERANAALAKVEASK